MLYDIGYGNRGIRNIKRVIEELSIDLLVDVRKRPYSSYSGSLNKNSLKELFGDKYLWVRELGGDTRLGINGNRDILENLRRLSDLDDKNILLMCCEADYRKCHRLKIFGYLRRRGLKKYKHLNITDFDPQTK